MIEIITQPIYIDRDKIESSFKEFDYYSEYIADYVVYYPYYYLVYNVKAKRLFLPANEKVGCAVDAVSGKGSLIDTPPKFIKISVTDKQLIQKKQSLDNCLALSKSFLFRSISLKMRMLSISTLTIERKKLFYRPYWIVFNSKKGHDDDRFIVDAVTGHYHPLV